MSSQSESDIGEQLEAIDEAYRQNGQIIGGISKNQRYCPECGDELDELNGACEFCSRADAVLEGL